MSISSKLKRWYFGGPLPAKEVIDESTTIHRPPNTFEPSTSAFVAQWCVKNFLAIIGIVMAALVPLFIHYDSKSNNEVNSVNAQTKNTGAVHAGSNK